MPLAALLPKVSALKETAILLKGKRNKLRKHLLQEDEFFASWESNKFDWKKYKKFCETTPRLEDNAELKDKRNADGWHLFSWYYPNSYFGVRQCLEIDALREFADSLKADERAHVLAAVISVTRACRNSPATLPLIVIGSSPRIKVQIKHRQDTATVQEVRQLMGLLQKDGDVGMFVSSGGFTSDAKTTARTSHVHVELVDFDRLISLWQEFYPKLTDEDKSQLALVPIYFYAPPV